MVEQIRELGYALVSCGKGLGVTFRNLLRRNVTLQYPEVKPEISPRFRGQLDFNQDTCIACSLCVKACPSKVLSLESSPPVPGKKGRVLEKYGMDLTYCMYCGLCVEACPTDALKMLPEYAYSCRTRDYLVYTKERLRADHVARFGETPVPEPEPESPKE